MKVSFKNHIEITCTDSIEYIAFAKNLKLIDYNDTANSKDFTSINSYGSKVCNYIPSFCFQSSLYLDLMSHI